MIGELQQPHFKCASGGVKSSRRPIKLEENILGDFLGLSDIVENSQRDREDETVVTNRVANYRDYDGEGKPVKGKFAEVFEAELANWAKDRRFKDIPWLKEPIEKPHNGYFAQDKKGILKDTSGDTEADDDVYNLIMKEKERWLSSDEPLRFIFSHSALREGWDNPNVFQICTLNETKSALKKRQEIGRGLRLPVDQNGLRVFDESINKLYLMANESYEDFAKALHSEYEEDCGVTFGKISLAAIAKLTRVVDGEEKHIGREAAGIIQAALVEQKMLDGDGRLQPAFDPKRPDFRVELPEGQKDLAPAVVDLLAILPDERHIRRARDEGTNPLRKEETCCGAGCSCTSSTLWVHNACARRDVGLTEAGDAAIGRVTQDAPHDRTFPSTCSASRNAFDG